MPLAIKKVLERLVQASVVSIVLDQRECSASILAFFSNFLKCLLGSLCFLCS